MTDAELLARVERDHPLTDDVLDVTVKRVMAAKELVGVVEAERDVLTGALRQLGDLMVEARRGGVR